MEYRTAGFASWIAGWILYSCISVACSCVFPNSFHGPWISSDRGFVLINDSMIYNYRLKGHTLSKMDLECIDRNDTLYLLRGMEDYEIFGTKFNMYICINMTQTETDSLLWTLQTDYNAYTRDHMDLSVSSTPLTMETVNHKTQYNIPLYKNVSFVDQINNVECPNSMQYQFSNISVSSQGGVGNVWCKDGALTGCDDKQRIRFEIPATCQSSALPVNFTLDCLYTKVMNDVTYLYTWSSDVIAFASYGQICLSIRQEGGNKHVELHANSCDSISDPFTLTLASPAGDCPSTTTIKDEKNPRKKKTKDESSSSVVVIVVVIFIVILVTVAVLLAVYFRDYIRKLLGKKTKAEHSTGETNFTDIGGINIGNK